MSAERNAVTASGSGTVLYGCAAFDFHPDELDVPFLHVHEREETPRQQGDSFISAFRIIITCQLPNPRSFAASILTMMPYARNGFLLSAV